MDFETARENMVHGQLLPNKITQKNLIDQFGTTPRELFVDPNVKNTSYADTRAKTSETRFLFAPMVAARLLQGLNLTPEDTLLVAAGGTGYSAAVAAPMVKKVVMVEGEAPLLDTAKKMISDLKLSNVQLLSAAPEKGAKAFAPYHKILLDAPAEEVPSALFEQLANGGKLAAVVQGADGLMEATIFTKNSKTIMQEALFETPCGEPLPNFKKEEKFVF